MAFGVYSAVFLAQERALRDEAKKKLTEGINPFFIRKKKSWLAMCNSMTCSNLWRLIGTIRR